MGSSRRVSMGKLEALWLEYGARDVRTYLQSGNVLFEHPVSDASKLASGIEAMLGRSLAFDVSVILRTRDDLQRIVNGDPFRGRDESKMHVTFLKSRPHDKPLDELAVAAPGGDEFRIGGLEVYLFCPNGYGRTKLSNAFFEKKLKVEATTRNWNTVRSLLSRAR